MPSSKCDDEVRVLVFKPHISQSEAAFNPTSDHQQNPLQPGYFFIEECEMDWESLYCPNRRCRYYGRPFSQGPMVTNGSSHGQKQALCEVGRVPQTGGYCFETSAVPPASYGPAGHEPSKPVRNPSPPLVALHLSKRTLPTPRSSPCIFF